NGSVTVAAGGLLNATGGFSNTGTVYAAGGAINGAIANMSGLFAVTGTVTSNDAFANASGATLGIAAGGHYTVGGAL
ncbi:hypothetical protein ABTP95_22260, partial [Acinetobacter baumannii]